MSDAAKEIKTIHGGNDTAVFIKTIHGGNDTAVFDTSVSNNVAWQRRGYASMNGM